MTSSTNKKTDMKINVNKGNIFADQTPTPTRFIRNCEEVGLFQDLNPFDETFRKATEAVKNGEVLFTEPQINCSPSNDSLHTPDVFPHMKKLEEGVQKQTLNEVSDCSKKENVLLPKARGQRSKSQFVSQNEPVIILCNGNPMSVKVPLPKITPKVMVYSPKYFSRFSKNIQNSAGSNRKNCGRKKKADGGVKQKTDDETREINRLAAIRTRNKKKHYIGYLEEFNRKLLEANADLAAKVTELTKENTKLKEINQVEAKCHISDSDRNDNTEQIVSLDLDNLPGQIVEINTAAANVLDEDDSINDAVKTEKECFYASIPVVTPDATPPHQLAVITSHFAGDISNTCFLRKPFKKRSITTKPIEHHFSSS